MKKIIFLSLVFMTRLLAGFAQIATYYPSLSVPVIQTSVHQIRYETMLRFWPYLIEHQYIHLYRQGQEIALEIHSKNDSYLKSGDYILFLGEPNNGTLDSSLYESLQAQANPSYSLFSDTATYQLTYEPSQKSLFRIGTEACSLNESYHVNLIASKEQAQVFSNSYFAGLVLTPFDNEQVWDSNYQKAEGWMSKSFTSNTPAQLTFNTLESTEDTINFKIRLISQKRTNQVLEITQGSQYVTVVELQPAEIKEINGTILLSEGNILNIKGVESLFAIASFKYDYAASFEQKEGQYLWRLPYPKKIPMSSQTLKVWNISDRYFPENALRIGDTIFTKATKIVLWENPTEITNLSPTRVWQPDTTANFLIVTHENLWNSALQYADYRTSEVGGAYRCEVVTSRMLYDYFNFGNKSTLAFQRYFACFKHKKNPFYVFLIGTGAYPQIARKSSIAFARDLVPTYGYPCSDTPFVINKNSSIGRLPAETNADVQAYLNKVIAFEKEDNTYFGRKQLLHLSGGRYGVEQNLFRNYLDSLADIAQKQNFTVRTIGKQTDAYVEVRNVSEEVNQGLGMITLFGHSAIGQLDLDIGYVSNPDLGYHNQDKYPFVLVNGCDAGDFFTEKKALSTDWVLSPNRGAIAFMAHTHLAYPNSLYTFSKTFYQQLFQENLSQTLGEVHAQVIKNQSADPYLKTTLQQFTLQGDPAIRLFKAVALPDIAFVKNSLTVDTQQDSLRITVAIVNYGRVSQLPFSLHLYINKEDIFQKLYETPLANIDSVSFKVLLKSDWQNNLLNIRLSLDEEGVLEEINKGNNDIELRDIYLKKTLELFYPSNWAIVSSSDIWLEGVKNLSALVQLQVADNSNFSSILLQKSITNQGIFRYLFKGLANDTTTYYWRVTAKDSVLLNGTFTYIPKSPLGWIQRTSEHFQAIKTSGIGWNNSTWKLQPDTLKIALYVPGADIPQSNYLGWVKVNDQQWLGNGLCYPWSSLNALTLDSQLKPYLILPQLSCGNSPYWIQNLNESLLLNEIPLLTCLQKLKDGDWLILWSHGRVDTQKWSEKIWASLQELGCSIAKLKSLPLGTPFLLVLQKGKKNILERFGTNALSAISQTLNLLPESKNWEMIPPQMGALAAVQSIFTDFQTLEKFGVYEIQVDDKSYLLPENLSFQVPYTRVFSTPIQVKFKAKQVQQNSQLRRWGILGKPYADLVIQASADTQDIEIGQELKIKRCVYNTSDTPFSDTIAIDWQAVRGVDVLKSGSEAFTPLIAHDSVALPVFSKVFEQAGDYTLRFVLNPSRHQEVNFSNNSAQVFIKVKQDNVAPTMLVQLDGRIAQNFEYFSPNPKLEIQLYDNNQSLFLRKENIEILVKQCQSCDWVAGSNSNITFLSEERGRLKLEYQAKNWLKDTVWISINAWDAVGVKSLKAYQIPIVIVEKNNPIQVTVFPNPLYTWTRLRLENLPEKEYWAVYQIFDVSGQKLYEVQQAVNATEKEIFWDGRNQEGNFLPNALYFYKLTLQNKESKDSLSIADTFTGKIVLDRK
ncbi:putative type IX secretion system sortase PorU2 [Flectobacillus longus]|uniref:putative type IX secretion system sortase PorU2 n=1 Tax=Flectobacillus longus TaxID=2984207 RepID=UPI0024B67987|nr:C25 family cysteine peptidase [Flectobacillus longus]MDI9878651.1 C25 family cysteine peptidase [Flectobacillus longus]